jgi:phenylacetate 2-hydroxylase
MIHGQNLWAANHDAEHFKSPMDFIPDRFMGLSTTGEGTQHFGYGAGTRMCAGAHLANRELYVIFTRLVLAFHIHEADDQKARPILDSIDCNSVPTSMVTQPRPFKVKLIPRDRQKLEGWVCESLDRTAHL